MGSNGNGIGRFICQLRHMTITYCRKGGSSTGVRQFVVEDLVKFAKENPQIVIDVVPKPLRHPIIIAKYCLAGHCGQSQIFDSFVVNGRETNVSLRNASSEEVKTMVHRVRDVSGYKVRAFPKWVLTKHPSIQGNWNPFTNN